MARHKQLHEFAEQIWKSKREGASYTQLQNSWKCSAATIRYHTENVDAKVKKDYEAGKTLEELATIYNTSTDVIKQVVEGEKNG